MSELLHSCFARMALDDDLCNKRVIEWADSRPCGNLKYESA